MGFSPHHASFLSSMIGTHVIARLQAAAAATWKASELVFDLWHGLVYLSTHRVSGIHFQKSDRLKSMDLDPNTLETVIIFLRNTHASINFLVAEE